MLWNEKAWDEGDSHPDDDDEIERGIWSSKTDYLLSMIGYAVGLGNVWRFPYLAYKNGGGAFLIPYTMMLAIAGLPLFFLECALGQFASLGPVSVWRFAPILQGVGCGMVLISALVSIYYNVILSYSLHYLFSSFQRVLPWSDCFSWADEKCSRHSKGICNVTSGGTVTIVNLTWVKEKNLTCDPNSIIYQAVEPPSKQYWDKIALRRSTGIDDTGGIVWYLAFCLLLAWILVGSSLVKGIKSSGKVVYFTALFPYFVLVVLLIRGITLDGALDGINFYIGKQSDISKLQYAEVWKDAATQIFFSLSTAWGGLIALSSYNPFNNNCYLDSIVVCITNCFTSVFAGFAIFSILGHMAHVLGKPVSEVADSGFGLTFIAYPEALTHLPLSPLWSFLFFSMIVTLGLDSQFALIETITTAIEDMFPKAMKKKRISITTGCCAVLFLLGLPCVTEAGIYWIVLIDSFCGGWTLLIAAVLELMGVCWMYGGNRFIEDIEMMIGKQTWLFWLWWRMCWLYVSPAVLTIILFWSFATFSAPTYGPIQYPTWSIVLGWLMTIFCIIWLPLLAILHISKTEGTLWERILKNCKPAANWGPALRKNRGERYRNMLDSKRGRRGLEIPAISSN
ncbi:sodium- and chloride-dependent neutral and basic amino acid transporter B(0+)-like [Microcaecilia unicolor]|uniref:Transporter n=1 Tax=Microcaecilia unicolor TaxID=1415580 RepID=A0A6P7YNI4_9AMPH|nr:sodium- and chloride-dependent neutral and basic amino acid transporter B(0+)-like [Microcaecilia unicolor]